MSDLATTRIGAAKEMARALKMDPVRTSLDRGGNKAVALRWRHDALHEQFAPMSEHCYMTWFGTPRRLERTSGGTRVRSSTLPGAVSLIPAGLEARWDIHGPLDTIHLYIWPSALATLAEENDLPTPLELIDRAGSADPVGSHLLAMIAQELDAPGPLEELYVEQLSTLVCIHLLRTHSIGVGRPRPVFQGGLTPRRLAYVLAIMRERLSEDLPLAVLAEAAGLSSFYFLRAFQQATGTTPHRRLVELRVERAVELLLGSKLPIVEVALACGFASQSHLTTWLRRLRGTTPARLRAGG